MFTILVIDDTKVNTVKKYEMNGFRANTKINKCETASTLIL